MNITYEDEKEIQELSEKYHLQPCPFCEYPSGFHIEYDDYGDRYFDICCTRKGCYLEHGAGWQFQKNDIKELLRMWNFRS